MYSLPPEFTITLVGLPIAMTLGLLFGMGPCLVSCLPYLGPVFLSMDGSIRQSWKILLPHSLGRLCVYAGLGLAAGMAGGMAKDAIGVQTVKTVLGAATLLMGLGLLAHRLPVRHNCLGKTAKAAPLMRGGLFLMGIGMGLTPCAPLGIVLISAAATGSAEGGLFLGLAFGAGAIAVPSLVYGIAVAYFSRQLRERLGNWRTGIERLSARLLIATGLLSLLR